MCRLSWNLGASNSWNPQGLSRPVMGLLYFYLWFFTVKLCIDGLYFFFYWVFLKVVLCFWSAALFLRARLTEYALLIYCPIYCGLAFVNTIYSWFMPSMRINKLNKKTMTLSIFHVIPDAYNLKFFLHSDIVFHCSLQAQFVYCGFSFSLPFDVCCWLRQSGRFERKLNYIHRGQKVQE